MTLTTYASYCILVHISMLFALTTTTPAGERPNDEELAFLADMLQNPKQIIAVDDDPEALENAAADKSYEFNKEYVKRDPEDIDSPLEYGWGGGRWGKRYDPFAVGGRFGKRQDPLGLGGRFGKRYDLYSVGGRFGKRYVDGPFNVGGRFGKRYDQFAVGGRFGKRYDKFAVGGRFGKRFSYDDDKRYDAFSVGGRFGKRSDGSEELAEMTPYSTIILNELLEEKQDDKRYDQYSVGGRFGKRDVDFTRFGRDVSNVQHNQKPQTQTQE